MAVFLKLKNGKPPFCLGAGGRSFYTLFIVLFPGFLMVRNEDFVCIDDDENDDDDDNDYDD